MIRDRAITPFTKRVYSILSFGWSGGPKTGSVLRKYPWSWPVWLHHWYFRCIPSYPSTLPLSHPWMAYYHLPLLCCWAIFSGFAMVQTLLIIMRKVSNLENYITIQHIELMNIVIMITGSIVGGSLHYGTFHRLVFRVEYEQYAFLNRATGPYWWAYLSMMSCNVFSPQFMWIKRLRTSIMFSFFISIVVNIGMWFERFVIIVTRCIGITLHPPGRCFPQPLWTLEFLLEP